MDSFYQNSTILFLKIANNIIKFAVILFCRVFEVAKTSCEFLPFRHISQLEQYR